MKSLGNVMDKSQSYSPPRAFVLGSLAELTEGGPNGAVDDMVHQAPGRNNRNTGDPSI